VQGSGNSDAHLSRRPSEVPDEVDEAVLNEVMRVVPLGAGGASVSNTAPAISDIIAGHVPLSFAKKVTGQVRLHFFPQTTVQNFLDSGI
jgi:hypothetical protein